MHLKRYFGDRTFQRTALALTLPILLQNLLSTSFALVDTLMISSLGPVELTAVGLCASWIQLLNVLLFGITSGAGVLVAQFWGAGNLAQVRRSYGCGLALSLGVAALFLLLTAGSPRAVMHLYSPDPQVIAAGGRYLRLIALSFPASALQQTANATLRSTEQVRTPMYGTVVSVALNIFLNYVLIFGHLGAPRLGLAGAAIASCAANWAGVAVTYLLSIRRGTVLRSAPRDIFRFDRAFLGRYFSVALPVMVNELLWGLGTAVLNMIYGHMGTLEYAALTVCNTLENVITTIFMSFANSANVLVGKEIGRGRLDRAYGNALAITCWTPVLAALLGVALILFRAPVVGIFRQEAVVTALAQRLLLFLGCIQPFKFLQYVHICGILRAGADGKVAALIDFIGSWCVCVPLAALGLGLGLPFFPVYVAVTTLDSLVKTTLVLIRFRSRKWMIRIS
ncbi:MAG: MATE family efflux transporter [Oscillospiraceae bacterium]|nr:MATE family efflux transporter [Oscillospiraceae bacterium]